MSETCHGPDHRRGQRYRPRDGAGTGPQGRAAGPDRYRLGGPGVAGKGARGRGCDFRRGGGRRLPTAGRFAAVNEIEAALGPVDVLLACAGFGTLTLVPDLALDTLRRTFEVNMFGVAESIEAVLPGMLDRGKGHIVGVASLAGYRGFPWMISYSASKAGLIAYLEAIAARPARRGITVTTVCPGFVRTAMSTRVPYKRKVKMIEPEGGRSPPGAGHLAAAAQLRLSLGHADRPGRSQAHARSRSSTG